MFQVLFVLMPTSSPVHTADTTDVNVDIYLLLLCASTVAMCIYCCYVYLLLLCASRPNSKQTKTLKDRQNSGAVRCVIDHLIQKWPS